MALIELGTLRDYWKKVYDSIIAHDAVDSGDPLKIGGKASTDAPTAVSVGDRVNAWFDLNGRLMVKNDQSLPTGASTEAKQDTLIAKDFATQTTLASLLAKVISAPATEAKQDTIITYVDQLETILTAIKDTAGIKKITDPIIIADKEATAFEQVTVDNTAGGTILTSATYATNTKAYITVENNNIRFRIDGGIPTATLGHLVAMGSLIELNSNSDIVNFKGIAISETSAVLNCTYLS